ncbi:hypothetical protein IMZ31_21485 (plasmid) [Pontibacillus sp. ALD_SL1]|uniref:hypothetical protein n=1 Tax=Pontibacillus sp. ALD_SL1 TaxID=2777185 RepID=UPI001A9784DE|nr:hypothetical protein [Pontibacillus sp. ALD_SL1]QST02026.1 hypothetical protein IMZ31_21485 [Pontibacillus sp. ALD_SL1]
MSEIPSYLVKVVKNELGNTSNSIFDKLFDEDIEDHIKHLIVQQFKDKDAKEVRYKINKDAIQKNKKRWFNTISKSVMEGDSKRTDIVKEMELAEKFLTMYGEEKFKTFYNAVDIDDLKRIRLEETRDWKEDKDSRLTEYPFFMYKTKKAAQNAWNADASIVIADVLLNEFSTSSLRNVIKGENDSVSQGIFAPYSRESPVISDEGIELDGQPYLTSEYSPDDEFTVKTMYKKDMIENEDVVKFYLRKLDSTDRKIFQSVLSFRNIDFISDQKIYIDSGQVVRDIFNDTSKQRYERVEQGLIKMAHITFHIIQGDNGYKIFHLFDKLERTENTNEFVVTVNEDIQQEFINNQVTHMYGDKLNKLKHDLSNLIIFPLQRRRLSMLRSENETTILTYSFFCHRMQLKRSRKRENMKKIEECLQEFVDRGVTVESFQRKNEYFYIKFLPIQNYEIVDLLGENTQMIDTEQMSLGFNE